MWLLWQEDDTPTTRAFPSYIYNEIHANAQSRKNIPPELRQGVRKAEQAGANHGGDIVERRVPPLAIPGRGDWEPVVDRLLPIAPLILQVLANMFVLSRHGHAC